MLKTKVPRRFLYILGAVSLIILSSVLTFARNTAPGASSPAQVKTGWKTVDNSKYYVLSDGSTATGWQEIGGNVYYFQASGAMATGWQNLNGQPYYFLDDGQAASGTLTIGDDIHHFTTGGVPATGWFECEGQTFYLDRTGTPCTGWQTIDGIPYCFDAEGLPCTGWQEENEKVYYLNEDGSVARGRHTIDGQVHYFTSSGEKILLVNPWNTLPEDYTVKLRKLDEDYLLASAAYPSLKEMLAACEAAGCEPVVCSAYRTQEYQETLFNRKVKNLMKTGLTQDEAQKEAATVVAVPGTSEHQLGLALDIIDSNNWKLDQSQENTKTQQWLMAHSWEYGWILRYPNGKTELTGIIYEPWHYRYVGKELAAELHNLEMCLEEYLQMLTDTVG